MTLATARPPLRRPPLLRSAGLLAALVPVLTGVTTAYAASPASGSALGAARIGTCTRCSAVVPSVAERDDRAAGGDPHGSGLPALVLTAVCIGEPHDFSAEHPSDRHGIPGYDTAETHAACQATGRLPQRPADALRSPAVGARLRCRWREARRERSHRRRGCGGGSSTGGLRRLLRGGRPWLRRDPRGQVAPRVAPAREHPQDADGSDPPAPARPAHRRGRRARTRRRPPVHGSASSPATATPSETSSTRC